MLTTNDLMTIDPDVVSPASSLREVVALMNKNRNRQLLVVENNKLVGIITDRDIRLAMNSPLVTKDPVARIALLESFTASSCMTYDPKTVTTETPIHKVAQIMSAYKYGALPVMDGADLVGIITVTDLLNQMALIPESEPLI